MYLLSCEWKTTKSSETRSENLRLRYCAKTRYKRRVNNLRLQNHYKTSLRASQKRAEKFRPTEREQTNLRTTLKKAKRSRSMKSHETKSQSSYEDREGSRIMKSRENKSQSKLKDCNKIEKHGNARNQVIEQRIGNHGIRRHLLVTTSDYYSQYTNY